MRVVCREEEEEDKGGEVQPLRLLSLEPPLILFPAFVQVGSTKGARPKGRRDMEATMTLGAEEQTVKGKGGEEGNGGSCSGGTRGSNSSGGLFISSSFPASVPPFGIVHMDEEEKGEGGRDEGACVGKRCAVEEVAVSVFEYGPSRFLTLSLFLVGRTRKRKGGSQRSENEVDVEADARFVATYLLSAHVDGASNSKGSSTLLSSSFSSPPLPSSSTSSPSSLPGHAPVFLDNTAANQVKSTSFLASSSSLPSSFIQKDDLNVLQRFWGQVKEQQQPQEQQQQQEVASLDFKILGDVLRESLVMSLAEFVAMTGGRGGREGGKEEEHRQRQQEEHDVGLLTVEEI
jgi:hypothetical protein